MHAPVTCPLTSDSHVGKGRRWMAKRLSLNPPLASMLIMLDTLLEENLTCVCKIQFVQSF